MTRQPRRGRLWWRETWFSICSRHGIHDPDCDLCTTGHWINDYRHKIGSVVFKRAPNVWRWWANRPSNKAKLLNFRKK